MVQSMSEKISSQEARLKPQEERQKGSIHDLSAVPSVHSTLKRSHQKLPSIQTLKEDARIQAEVERRMQECSDISHNDHISLVDLEQVSVMLKSQSAGLTIFVDCQLAVNSHFMTKWLMNSGFKECYSVFWKKLMLKLGPKC